MLDNPRESSERGKDSLFRNNINEVAQAAIEKKTKHVAVSRIFRNFAPRKC
jgi:hypothetical protein